VGNVRVSSNRWCAWALSRRGFARSEQSIRYLTRGELYHAIVVKFLRVTLAKKMLPLTKANLAKAHAMVDEILTGTASRIP
jgi:hypothetical protein